MHLSSWVHTFFVASQYLTCLWLEFMLGRHLTSEHPFILSFASSSSLFCYFLSSLASSPPRTRDKNEHMALPMFLMQCSVAPKDACLLHAAGLFPSACRLAYNSPTTTHLVTGNFYFCISEGRGACHAIGLCTDQRMALAWRVHHSRHPPTVPNRNLECCGQLQTRLFVDWLVHRGDCKGTD